MKEKIINNNYDYNYSYNDNRKNIKITKLVMPKIAKLISFVFDGSVLALPIFLSIYFNDRNKLLENLPSLLITIFSLAIIPYSLIVLLYKLKKISDLHIPKRRERILPLIIINVIVIAGFISLNFVPATLLLKTTYEVYIFTLIILSLISIFWKISFHTSYATLFAVIFITIYGKWGLFALILIPIMIWARTILKRHTLSQATSGVLITFSISLTVFMINNFPTFKYLNSFLNSLILSPTKYLISLIFINEINFLFLTFILIILLILYKLQLSKNYFYKI